MGIIQLESTTTKRTRMRTRTKTTADADNHRLHGGQQRLVFLKETWIRFANQI